jgi:hypothetical protein
MERAIARRFAREPGEGVRRAKQVDVACVRPGVPRNGVVKTILIPHRRGESLAQRRIPRVVGLDLRQRLCERRERAHRRLPARREVERSLERPDAQRTEHVTQTQDRHPAVVVIRFVESLCATERAAAAGVAGAATDVDVAVEVVG